MDRKIEKIFSTIIIFILILAYSSFMLIGTQTRYMQDDYCYGEKVRNEGFFAAQYDSYFGSVPYPGNRYALTFFTGIFELFTEKAYPLFILCSTTFFVLGLILLLSNICKVLHLPLQNSHILFTGLAMAFLTLYIAPNRFQTVYLRSSSISYFYPIVFNVWISYFFLQYIRTQKKSLLPVLVLLTFLSSGFSEVGGVIQFSFWIFLLVVFMIKKRGYNAILASSIIVAVSFSALILLILCPNNVERQANFGAPNNLGALIEFGPKYALDFISYSIRGYSIPFLIAVLLAFLISLQTGVPFLDLKKALKYMIVTVVLAYLLIVANILPSLYAYRSYPDERGLMPATFILLVAIFLVSFFAGWMLKTTFKRIERSSGILQILLTFVLAVYFIHAGINVIQDYPEYHERAILWDARHTYILEKIEQGETEILVPALDSFHLTFELQMDPDHWVNQCAAAWYGINAIMTNE